MQLYTAKDIELAKEKLGDIVEAIDKKKLDIFEPTKKEILSASQIVLDFVKENKRKIYGGTAQNALVAHKNKDDAFYGEDVLPDIDFYSPDPIGDMKKIANILYDKGYKFVEGSEAGHGETYKVFANHKDVADISYVPKNIYYRIPFVEIDGVNYAHPSFIMLDMYRMLTEPYFSSFRWEKTFPRIYLLQKHYPFNKATSKLPKIDQIKSEDKSNVDLLLSTVFNFIKDKESAIVTGKYAYNVMLHESKIMDDSKLGQKYRYVETHPYQFISTDYRDDVKAVIDKLKQDNKTLASGISIVEHYPFWQLYGYSTYVYYKNYQLCHIIHHNRRCTPFKTVDAYIFPNGKVGKEKGKIRIGSFSFTLLMNLSTAFRYRVTKDNDMYQFYNIMTSHLIEIRNYYLDKNKKNLLDDTLFEEFAVECMGETIDPMRENRLIRAKKFLERKGPVVYRYRPESEYDDSTTSKFRFPNSSGNAIHKERNYKILGEDIPRKDKEDVVSDDETDDAPELEAKEIEKAAMGKKKK